jgi:centrosomal protein CEP290
MCRWAESELQQAHAQLELGLAARTETWKASLWARKLQQLKGRNDLLAGGLGAALRQLGAVADQLQAAELQLEVVQVGRV